MKAKYNVIVDGDGNVLGTQRKKPTQAEPSADEPQPVAKIVPLPGQFLHEAEIDLPPSMTTQEDIENFHKELQAHIAKRK